jgi:hypothetical protein
VGPIAHRLCDFMVRGLNFPSIVLVVTLSEQDYAQASLDEFTLCSVAVGALASHDERKTQQVSQFINQVLEQLDREHGQLGEPAILNDGLKTALVAATRGACGQRERSTISIRSEQSLPKHASLVFGDERKIRGASYLDV